MSAIAAIGNALRYDAVEDMLARGVSFATVYAFAAANAEASLDHDNGPDSTRPTMMSDTVRTGKAA